MFWEKLEIIQRLLINWKTNNMSLTQVLPILFLLEPGGLGWGQAWGSWSISVIIWNKNRI